MQCEAALYAELCSTFGTDKTRTTSYRPLANEKSKPVNCTPVAMQRHAVQKRPFDWESLIAPVLQSYRSTITEATGFTPYRLVFGREMRLPVDVGTPLAEVPLDVRTFASKLAEDLEWSYKVAREVISHEH